ncbi:metallophosphoesterase [Cupriavidus sp. P-10]|nr:metallophosphoesterase [Cupriavidus sp. P-10]
MFHIYLGLAAAYLLWRFVPRLPLSRKCRALISALVVATAMHFLAFQLVWGNMFSPEFPRPLVAAVGFLFGAFGLLVAFTVVCDAVSIVWRCMRISGWSRRRDALLRGAAGVLALCLSAAGIWAATRLPEVRRIEVNVGNLAPRLDGFTLVQLSDLHISRLFPEEWVSGVVARTNALRPDLVVITGDLIDGHVTARKADVRPLAALSAHHGVLAILGNHEYYFGADAWREEFEALGMRMLVNEHAVVSTSGGSLVVTGIPDPVAASFSEEPPNFQKAVAGASPDQPMILLSHRPSDAEQHAQAGVALQLSGHTHGGMLRGFDWFVARLNEGFVSGLYEIGGMHLYVSNGTGLWNGFPLRIGVPAEITEFVLRAKR